MGSKFKKIFFLEFFFLNVFDPKLVESKEAELLDTVGQLHTDNYKLKVKCIALKMRKDSVNINIHNCSISKQSNSKS